MKTLSLIFVLLFAPLAAAQQTLVDFQGKAGTYLVTIDAQGKMTVATVKVVKVGGTVDPQPQPEPDPTLTARGVAIRDAAAKATADPNRDETAAKLGVLYGEISRRIKAGEIKGQESISFILREGQNAVIKDAAAWKSLKDVLTAQWTKLAQEGGKDADYAKLLDEVAAGVNASLTLNQAIDLVKLLELIKVILDLLSKLPVRP